MHKIVLRESKTLELPHVEKMYYCSENFLTISFSFQFLLAQLCKETKGCEYWSWIDPERWINHDYPIENYCHLKDDNSGQQDMVGVVSGYKICPQELSKFQS